MADDLDPQGLCLLTEIEGVLATARRAPSIKHAWAIIAVRVQDIAYRYRELHEAAPDDADETLHTYLQGR